MQQLLVEFKNTSGDAPQVPCSVNGALNREETLSVPRKVLANNSSEEDLHSGKRGQALSVPVINMHKKPCLSDLKNSEQVEIPAGLDWIKAKYGENSNYYNFNGGEKLAFFPSLTEGVSSERER